LALRGVTICRMHRTVLYAAIVLTCALIPGRPRAASPAPQDATARGTDAQQCEALLQTDFGNVPGAPARVISARLVDVPPADPKLPPTAAASLLAASPVKQYCQVLGYVAPQNKFELRLPFPAQWNQRFHLTPCAGFCGVVNGNACNLTLARGYASITGNGGHDSPVGFDGVWAANSPNLQEDFAWRHNHVITLAGKAITTSFYGRPIARSYMSGCSKGGHGVLMEAQKFPEDFDGLLPSAPVYDLVGRTIAAAWWAQAAKSQGQGYALNDEAAKIVHASVLRRCGAQSGVDEGVVSDPASCDWKPEMIACPTSGAAACLTQRQVDAVRKMMAPVTNSKGQVLYKPTDIPGTATEWGFWHYQRGDQPSGNYTIIDQFLRFMADPTVRTAVDPMTFDFDKTPQTLDRARALYNATSFDLRAFKARGGRMLMWHGLSDAAITATSSIAYYDGVEKLMGGRAQTQDFFRLFLVPGVHHCAGGPGFAQFDALTLLENWVEKGQAPDVLIASRVAGGAVERSRPIYPYPLLARYSGQGDPKAASSFVAHDPTKR
jgi:feruloyl esterase